jgi:hypothetical protein
MSAAVVAVGALGAASCADIRAPSYSGAPRSFVTSFESVGDFSGFYIVPPGVFDSSHELSTDNVYHGTYAHKAWITAARAPDNDGSEYRPHRAYPTVNFQKTADGIYRTPCLVSIWVYLDMTLLDRQPGHIDDWMSFATLTPDASDNWTRTVLVNTGPDGYARLMHVPRQGEQVYQYQADSVNDPSGSLRFPYRQWVRFDVFIDFDAANGYAKLWQNGRLVSSARVEGGAGGIAQAHFGLYASAAVPSGTVYNDRLRIVEVADESEAAPLVQSAW